jgi:polar amino acid transport system permease protein
MEEDGKIYGLDIEIAASYAKSRGLELVIKNIGFEDIFVQVDTNYADIGMAGITATPERAEIFDFTSPYYDASQKLIVLSQNNDFDDCKTVEDVENVLSSLQSEKIGYQSATTASLYINGNEDWGFEGFDNINGKAYANAQVAITDLINGNIYGVILDEAPANFIINAMNVQQDSSWEIKFKNFFETISNEYYWNVFLKGLLNTIKVAIIGLIIGVFIGTLIAIIKVAPKYKLIYKVLDKICSFYTLIFRGTPIVAQLLIAYYVIMPTVGIKMDALTVGMIVFGMNSGAYVSEIMRGGLNSVDKGQMEAGRALGLTYSTTMIKIVVPQAVKNILPTLGNEFISLIKETSVLSFIAVYDLYKALLDVGMVKYDSMVPYIMMGLIYIVLVLIISFVIKLIERRFAKSDRN